MTDETKTPVDPARVHAVLAVMAWPDDSKQRREAFPGPRFYWELAEEIIRAADAASSEKHIIEIRPDGWTIQHPLSCRPNLFDCPVNRAGEAEMASLKCPPAPPGRYECFVNDLGDRFLLGDRVDQEDAR
ncbi:DUF6085 family protein [Micromonospora sp. WMMD1076]|uniref:DUF6085 family protein n=1 Tax=Micromonospora sp. WMMD1076 TaxID=3016103 RepID=UPI00249C5109|nr:DUF6085 family protein [Micromonospora sp. WMMD1076]WFF07226.1 DUF6085 family protein [Micromonospora sp. WMMD1076]